MFSVRVEPIIRSGYQYHIQLTLTWELMVGILIKNGGFIPASVSHVLIFLVAGTICLSSG